jgi:hypothetical protein
LTRSGLRGCSGMAAWRGLLQAPLGRIGKWGRRVTALAAAGLAGAIALGGISYATARPQTPSRVVPLVVASVGRTATGSAIPAGFLGLSIEYWAVEAYAGRDARAINPILVQLIRALAAGHPTVLRIGGVSTDKTWWPIRASRPPLGVNYALTRRRLAVIKALANAVGARLILGINLEVDSRRVASVEAKAMVADIGRRRIAAFELGNEPELYGNRNFAWYVRDGENFTGRPWSYDMAAFTRDFSTIGAVLPPAPLAGPTSGGRRWLSQLAGFVAAEPRLGLVTVHRYPLQACYNTPASPTYPTISGLLSSAASRGLADGVSPDLAVAHKSHLRLRIDEMNDVSCGNPPGVPNTFAMALWALDALFADARVGVDGVNIHTYPGAVYQLFKFRRTSTGWRALVEPEYYGLLMFAQAAPPGARLLPTSGGSEAVRIWATQDRQGSTRVVLINDDPARSYRVSLHVARARGVATLERLEAPTARASSGVTLGGQGFGPASASGVLSGQRSSLAITATAGRYTVRLPPASAALLTLR